MNVYTVLGRRFANAADCDRCFRSWTNLPLGTKVRVISDGSLTDEDVKCLHDRYGFEVVSDEEIGDRVVPRLRLLPRLMEVLADVKHFRKSVFVPLLAVDEHRTLLIDSDVYLTERISFPTDAPSFLFSCDDVPAYRLRWQAALRVPMPPCINSGFVLFDPAQVDVEYLNDVLSKYRERSGNRWWIEQGSWAVHSGRTNDLGLFDGRDARVVSGLGKRSARQIQEDRFNWFRSRGGTSESEVRSAVAGAAVIHFAGPGKKWLHLAEPTPTATTEPRLLRWKRVNVANSIQKVLLAVRLKAIEFRELRRARAVAG